MKNLNYRMLAVAMAGSFLSVVPCQGSTVVAQVDDGTPMGYFAAQDAELAEKSEAILAATTPEELIELGVVHERIARSYLANSSRLSAEDKAAFVNDIKGGGLATHRAVAERIDGDRAVVLRESPHPDAWNIAVIMSRADGVWTPGSEEGLQNLTGARGSFAVTGATTAQVTDGLLEQPTLYSDGEETPYLVLSDMLDKILSGQSVPTVEFMPPGCPAVGSYPLTNQVSSFSTGGEDFVHTEVFNENVSGTLEVTRVEGDRYWGRFEMTAVVRTALNESQDPTRAVTIVGTIENVPNSCQGGA